MSLAEVCDALSVSEPFTYTATLPFCLAEDRLSPVGEEMPVSKFDLDRFLLALEIALDCPLGGVEDNGALRFERALGPREDLREFAIAALCDSVRND